MKKLDVPAGSKFGRYTVIKEVAAEINRVFSVSVDKKKISMNDIRE